MDGAHAGQQDPRCALSLGVARVGRLYRSQDAKCQPLPSAQGPGGGGGATPRGQGRQLPLPPPQGGLRPTVRVWGGG